MNMNKAWIWVLVIIVLGAAGLVGAKILHSKLETTTGYQAVFLTNGQVYFGKLSETHHPYAELTDVYYLQVTENLQAASTADQAKNATPTGATTPPNQSNIQLIKLGNELHGPTDKMYIERDKILFWENMKDDSKVVAAIKQNQGK